MLKIVLAATGFGVALAIIISNILTPPQNAIEEIAKLFALIISSLFQGFAWVTIVFGLLQHFGSKEDIMKAREWKPSDLPPVPAEKAGIKRSEPIVGIAFGIIFLIIVNAAPYWLGVVVAREGIITIIPIFNQPVFSRMLLYINAIICLGILKEACRLLAGRYTARLAAAVTVISIISLLLTILVFTKPEIWNGSFIESLKAAYGIDGFVADMLSRFWTFVPQVIVGLAVLGPLWKQ